jgi:hypothetical protein
VEREKGKRKEEGSPLKLKLPHSAILDNRIAPKATPRTSLV